MGPLDSNLMTASEFIDMCNEVLPWDEIETSIVQKWLESQDKHQCKTISEWDASLYSETSWINSEANLSNRI